MQPGIYADISNHDYHSGPGISKSQLDLVARAPALLEWSKQAPRSQKTGAAEIGDAFHALLLEPARFSMEYIVAPDGINRSTNDGKSRWAALQAEAGERHILTYAEGQQLHLMRESAMAHPDIRQLIEADGLVEGSYYWIDEETGILCRCRPDKAIGGCFVDLKTTDDVWQFQKSVANCRYHVQDAFYSEGGSKLLDDFSGFLFIVVGKKLEMGRYPVRVVDLLDEVKAKGRELWRRDLDTVKQCQQSGEWPGVETISLPAWA
jgi:hypothetical protein